MPSSPSGPPQTAQVVSGDVRDDIADARLRINTSSRCTSSQESRALSGRVADLVIRLDECAHSLEKETLRSL